MFELVFHPKTKMWQFFPESTYGYSHKIAKRDGYYRAWAQGQTEQSTDLAELITWVENKFNQTKDKHI